MGNWEGVWAGRRQNKSSDKSEIMVLTPDLSIYRVFQLLVSRNFKRAGERSFVRSNHLEISFISKQTFMVT